MNWKSLLVGIGALALFDGIVSRKGATSNVGGWLASAGRAAEWFLSPTVPAFKGASSSSPPSSAPPPTVNPQALTTATRHTPNLRGARTTAPLLGH